MGSRLLLFAVAFASLTLQQVELPEGAWQAFPNTSVLDGWARWDSAWYVEVARSGYIDPASLDPDEARNTAFFPLYPLVIAVFSMVSGDAFLAGIIVSNFCFLLSALVLYKLVCHREGEMVAFLAVCWWSLFPYSLFFSAVYPESLFMLLALSSFLLVEQGRCVLGGSAAALAGATSPFGLLLVPVLLLVRAGNEERSEFGGNRSDLGLLLGLLGPLAYIGFLWATYGNPLEFIAVQLVPEWVREVRLFPLNEPERILFVLFLSASAFLVTVRPMNGYAWWSLLVTTMSYWHLMAFGRLALMAFPILVLLSSFRRAYWLLLPSTALLIWNTHQFAQWRWVG